MKRLLLIISLIIFSNQIFAHKVNIFAYAENGKIFTESFFSDGKRAVNSKIKVYDNKSSKLLLEGKTDKNGKFAFDIPYLTDLKIVLIAGEGHKNYYLLKGNEIKPAMKNLKKNKNKNKNKTNNIKNTNIDKIIEKKVDEKIDVVMQKLIKIEEKLDKPKLSDILGGIGYIIGIFGIIAYFKSREKK